MIWIFRYAIQGYPSELTLVNTNTSPRTVTFLDLGITLHHGKFKHHLYD